MKFSSAIKGRRAERPCSFPIPGAPADAAPLECVAVPLTVDEEGAAHAFARKYAKTKGVDDAKAGDPLYDLGYAAQVVAFAIRDPESGETGKREATFRGGTDEILAELSRETLMYLYAIAEEWCDECSPSARTLTDAGLIALSREIARREGDDGQRFLDRFGPGTQRLCLLFTARRLWSLLEPKSPSGSPTTNDGSPNDASPSDSSSPIPPRP